MANGIKKNRNEVLSAQEGFAVIMSIFTIALRERNRSYSQIPASRPNTFARPFVKSRRTAKMMTVRY